MIGNFGVTPVLKDRGFRVTLPTLPTISGSTIYIPASVLGPNPIAAGVVTAEEFRSLRASGTGVYVYPPQGALQEVIFYDLKTKKIVKNFTMSVRAPLSKSSYVATTGSTQQDTYTAAYTAPSIGMPSASSFMAPSGLTSPASSSAGSSIGMPSAANAFAPAVPTSDAALAPAEAESAGVPMAAKVVGGIAILGGIAWAGYAWTHRSKR